MNPDNFENFRSESSLLPKEHLVCPFDVFIEFKVKKGLDLKKKFHERTFERSIVEKSYL